MESSSIRRWKLINPGDLAKRIIFGIIGSALVSTVLLFFQIRRYILIGMAAILSFFGYKIDPPQEIKDTVSHAVAKVDEAVEKKLRKIDEAVDRKVSEAAKKMPNIGVKSPEQLKFEAEQKEEERRRKEESERRTLNARLEATGETPGDSWSLEKLRLHVERAEQRARINEEKRPYLKRARAVNLECDASWDVKTLRRAVEEAEQETREEAAFRVRHAAWEKAMKAYRYRLDNGPNAQCPGCAYQITTARNSGSYICPRCRDVYYITQALACFTPPDPPEEPTRYSVSKEEFLGRFK